MSCIEATYRLIGEDIHSEFLNIETGCAKYTLWDDMVTTDFIGQDISAQFNENTEIEARFTLVCSTGIIPLYLEIEPVVLWVFEDYDSYNDVYSNTSWNIN